MIGVLDGLAVTTGSDVDLDARAAGLALYFFNYSTWISRNGLYLEDLYVKPEFRRQGVARVCVEAERGR